MTRQHLALGAAALLAASACGGKTFRIPSTLPNDFLVYNVSRFENTAKVVSPGVSAACNLGAIAIATGQDRPGELVTRPLYDSSNAIDTTTIGTATGFPFDAALESIATDNQMIRLADGSLLAMKNGYRWDPIAPQPDWWDSFTFDGSTWASYSRNSVYFWKSTDCGATWTRVGHIDPAAHTSGRYAWPQPVDDNQDGVQDLDVNGKPKVGIGGFDRTEGYQDPWSQTLYVSGHGDGGPYQNGATNESYHKEVLFYSTDGAATWTVMAELDYSDKGNAPFVMTSTPNGRFYAFSCTGGTPALFYTKTPGDPATLSDGKDVSEAGEKCGIDTQSVIARSIWQPSISRVSLDATTSVVRIAYPTLNTDGRQVYQISSVTIDDANPDAAPTVEHVFSVESDDPAKRSVMYASFIDPDYVDYQTASNFAALYWVETSITGDPVKICAKYQMYLGTESSPTGQNYLSQSNGAPRCWSDATLIGDYFSGGFFWADSKLNYFAQWVEADGIHGNVITVKP